MKKEIILLELFSGIGGFALGFQEAGFKIKKHFFSEVDKHAIANYKYNFKNAEYIGSVTNVRHIIKIITDQKRLGNNLIITFGSPCQDFSLAGKRKGIEGSKSSLIKYALFLVKWLRPNVFIWENVKGAFSTNNGADYWAIIQAVANLRGYRCEQQLLNTSWFLPQNRERIYLVGHLTGRSTRNVFPITENDRLFDKTPKPNPGRPQTKHSTALKSSGAMKADDTFIKIPNIAGCLTGGGHSGGLHSDMTVIPVQICKPSRTDEAKELRKQSIKNGKDHTPFQGKKIEFIESDVMNTITCATQKDNLIKVQSNTKKGYDVMTHGDSLNLSLPNSKTRRGRVGKGVSQTLDTACNQGVIAKQNNIQQDAQIRRLTEIECERLQGFPDDWTKFGDHNGTIKEISKSQRYKLCGNAVSIPPVRAIAERLNM